MSKKSSDEQQGSIEQYDGSSRSTVWIVLSISAVLAIVAMVGTVV